MAASRSDRFYAFDPADPPEPGSRVSCLDDPDIGPSRPGKGSDAASSRSCATITVAVPGRGQVSYAGETRFLGDGRRIFVATDGQPLCDGTFVSASFLRSRRGGRSADPGPACFTAGTRVETVTGPVPIEELGIGDKVVALDNGLRPVRWIGRREVIATGRHAPVRFGAYTVGNSRPLWVSPQQRVLVSGWRAEFLFGIEEALVPARHLVDGSRIVFDPRPRIAYIHLLFDGHEIVLAEGAPTESFHPGDWADERDAAARYGIDAIFPDAVGCRLRALRGSPPVAPGPEGAEPPCETRLHARPRSAAMDPHGPFPYGMARGSEGRKTA